MTDLLLSVPVDHPRPNVREERRKYVAEMKEKHEIFTHHCAGAGDWMALDMPLCRRLLNGYDMTREEKTDGVALMAGYGRLLDEAHMIEENHKTEYDAVKAIVDKKQ